MPVVTPDRYRRVVLAALVALAVIVVTGAAVRLTQSGLGCTDWPACEEGRLAPEWAFHGWIEFGNRLFTGVVSLAVIAAVLAAWRRRPYRRDLLWWAWGLVVGVLAQAILGGITVLLELHPVAVMGHFLLSMVLLANAIVLLDAASHERPPPRPPTGTGGGSWSAHSRVVVAMATLVLLTGTVVTGTGPHGGDTRAERLPLELTWVARLHASVVWVFVAVVLALALRVIRLGHADLDRRLRTLLVVAVAQGGVGYLQYALAVPAGLVALHVIGATAVWCAALWVHLGVRRTSGLLADWSDGGGLRAPPSPVSEPVGQRQPITG